MAGQQGAGGGGQEGGDKNTYYILWMIALVAVVCGLVWYFFDEKLPFENMNSLPFMPF
jgi:hypothetical protein